jgi:hypothetical protein
MRRLGQEWAQDVQTEFGKVQAAVSLTVAEEVIARGIGITLAEEAVRLPITES